MPFTLGIGRQELLHRGVLERRDQLLDVVGVGPLAADGELTGELVGRRRREDLLTDRHLRGQVVLGVADRGVEIRQ